MKAQIISFHCVLKNSVGKVISTSFSHDVITKLAVGGRAEIPGLCDGLQDVQRGERRKITVDAGEAYGFYDLGLVKRVSRVDVATSGALSVGENVCLADSAGKLRSYRVTEINGDTICLDANHPLAGQDLVFEVHIVDAREATAEEISESSQPSIPHNFH